MSPSPGDGDRDDAAAGASSSSLRSLATTGLRYASVFPDPVCDARRRSEPPERIAGIAVACVERRENEERRGQLSFFFGFRLSLKKKRKSNRTWISVGSMIPIVASAEQTSPGRPSAAKAGLGARGGGEEGVEGASACEFSSSAASSADDGNVGDDDAALVDSSRSALDRPRHGAECWAQLSVKRPRTGVRDRLRSRGARRRDWLGGGGIRRWRDGGNSQEAAAAEAEAEALVARCLAALIWIPAVLFEGEEEEDKEEISSSVARRRRRMQQEGRGEVEVEVQEEEEEEMSSTSVRRRKKIASPSIFSLSAGLTFLSLAFSSSFSLARERKRKS